MNEEILKRLDVFAAKLGVTADKLWSILIIQARVEGWTDLIAAVVCWTLVGVYIYSLKRFGKNIVHDDEGYGPLMLFFGIVATALLIVAVISTFSVPTELFNPGYFAFHRLASELKP